LRRIARLIRRPENAQGIHGNSWRDNDR
jgi:hypothetical protein